MHPMNHADLISPPASPQGYQRFMPYSFVWILNAQCTHDSKSNLLVASKQVELILGTGPLQILLQVQSLRAQHTLGLEIPLSVTLVIFRAAA